jgi:hypothetical protein
MEKFNTVATRILTAGVLGTALTLAANAFDLFDDGIAGCFEKEGRAHFMMDDGTLSAEPIKALSFDNEGKNCTISHGGGQAPDIYPRVDVVGSDYAKNLVEQAASYTEDQWTKLDEAGSPYDSIEAYINGSDITFEDESGETITGELASLWTEALTSASRGTPEHPETDAPVAKGSVIVAYKTNDGIGVARVPANEGPNFQ